ncbi:MAG: transaldolase [Waddliaceae bacterium]|nr:transaldolase [Waddliaceae bacterium]
MSKSKLEQLKEMTVVVADTGDINSIKQYTPTDATTNPSLIYQAAQMPEYRELMNEAMAWAKSRQTSDEKQMMTDVIDRLTVNFGKEILKIVPGRVSTEVDARLSFDTEGSIRKARHLISMYEEAGISKERVLIKMAATWEGTEAARVLEKEGIHCNMTLMFNLVQAVACAEAGATLISPFVGRILDWHKQKKGVDHIPADEDPGVLSVTKIYNYYKRFSYSTEVMGASFRNADEIIALAGCDLLTIAPKLLEELQNSTGPVKRMLSEDAASSLDCQKMNITENFYRWHLNQDAMATEKLAEGIRNFGADLKKLEKFISSNCMASM